MSYPSRTLIAATDLGSNPLDLQLLNAWSIPATEQDFPMQLEVEEEAESEMDEKAESVEKKGQSGEIKMEVKVEVKEEEPVKETGYNLRHNKIALA